MASYAHPPIIEAVLDIQVKFSSLPPKVVFEGLVSKLQRAFPVHVEANLVNFNLTVNSAGEPSTTTQRLGTGQRMTNAANDRVLLAQPRGMTLSHLAPYSSWERFRQEGVDAWREYVQALQPQSVTRLALRYINRIHIPEERFLLESYFTIYPQIPDIPEQAISQFVMRIQVPQMDMPLGIVSAGVNIANAGRRDADGAHAIMLDIDLAAVQELHAADEAQIFARLDQLRVRKNELFESYITDKTRELFK